jgi:hypothetical protein
MIFARHCLYARATTSLKRNISSHKYGNTNSIESLTHVILRNSYSASRYVQRSDRVCVTASMTRLVAVGDSLSAAKFALPLFAHPPPFPLPLSLEVVSARRPARRPANAIDEARSDEEDEKRRRASRKVTSLTPMTFSTRSE